MPRRPRYERDGEQHHVVIKGHNGDAIVSSDHDREELTIALTAALLAAGVTVWAWALLTNHIHLILCGRIGAISLAMQQALSPYALQRNRRSGRSGAMFNQRFWSRPIHDEPYAFAAVLYTLLNPLKAGIVRTLEELSAHRWCSLGALVQGSSPEIPVDASTVLGLFGRDEDAARRVVVAKLEDNVRAWKRDCEMGSLPAILRVVAARHGLPPETLSDGTRGRWFVEARRDVVREARQRGYSNPEIATALGMTRAAVWKIAA